MKQFNQFLESTQRQMVGLKFTEDTLYPFVFFQATVGHGPNGYAFRGNQYKLYWDKYLYGEPVRKRLILPNQEGLIFKFHDLSQIVQAGPSMHTYTVENLLDIAQSKFPVIQITELDNIDIIPIEDLSQDDQIDASSGLF